MRKNIKTIVIILTVMLGLSFIAMNNKSYSAENDVVTLKVEGMFCGGCANSVKSAIEEDENVQSAKVMSIKTGIVKVYPVKGKKIDTNKLVKLLKDYGYNAVVK